MSDTSHNIFSRAAHRVGKMMGLSNTDINGRKTAPHMNLSPSTHADLNDHFSQAREQIRSDAATKIQAGFRGSRDRQRLQSEKRNAAATKIQALLRGHEGRNAAFEKRMEADLNSRRPLTEPDDDIKSLWNETRINNYSTVNLENSWDMKTQFSQFAKATIYNQLPDKPFRIGIGPFSKKISLFSKERVDQRVAGKELADELRPAYREELTKRNETASNHMSKALGLEYTADAFKLGGTAVGMAGDGSGMAAPVGRAVKGGLGLLSSGASYLAADQREKASSSWEESSSAYSKGAKLSGPNVLRQRAQENRSEIHKNMAVSQSVASKDDVKAGRKALFGTTVSGALSYVSDGALEQLGKTDVGERASKSIVHAGSKVVKVGADKLGDKLFSNGKQVKRDGIEARAAVTEGLKASREIAASRIQNAFRGYKRNLAAKRNDLQSS